LPLYYFHLRDGHDVLLDPEGRELDGTDAILTQALRDARSIISDDALRGRIMLNQRIDVEDALRNVVLSLEFADAIEIVRAEIKALTGSK
jgi:hypothetical protein